MFINLKQFWHNSTGIRTVRVSVDLLYNIIRIPGITGLNLNRKPVPGTHIHTSI